LLLQDSATERGDAATAAETQAIALTPLFACAAFDHSMDFVFPSHFSPGCPQWEMYGCLLHSFLCYRFFDATHQHQVVPQQDM
jgi:hypothetical protein